MNFIGVLLLVSIALILFGLDQFFTVRYGSKWYPCLSMSFWKIPDKLAVKMIFIGLTLFFLTLIISTILNNLGFI